MHNARAATKEGFAIHVYACNQSMHTSALANADGDFLIVPQQGEEAESREDGGGRAEAGGRGGLGHEEEEEQEQKASSLADSHTRSRTRPPTHSRT